MHIQQITQGKKRFLDLLLLADEQESMIDCYLEQGTMFALYENGLKSICVVIDKGDGFYELKNIATYPQYQGQGYGKRLIQYLFEHYQGRCRTMSVGTEDNPSAIHFYEHCGFTYSHTIPDFFTDHYDHPIYEAGKLLTDMIYLKKKIAPHIIESTGATDHIELTLLWEASVRSTHHFLTEKDIQFYKPLVLDTYLPSVQLYIIRNEQNRIAAFIGLSNNLIEMLFIHPQEQRKGYGKRLVEFATREKHIRKVDVNEQNQTALYFYQNQGFEIICRNEKDEMGMPFPILHLELQPIYLRKASLNDIEQLHQVFETCVRNTCNQDYNNEQINAWIARATPERWESLFNSDLHFIVAEEMDFARIIGFTSVTSEGYLHSMFVHPQYQRTKIGTILLRKAETLAIKQQAKSMFAEASITAKPFFEKMGYAAEKEQAVVLDQIEMINFVMRKKL